jgi:LmbE family N-acetylglucosaminyl deacetylase
MSVGSVRGHISPTMKLLDRPPLVLALALAASVGFGSAASAQLEPLEFDRGGSGLGLALRRVGASGRVLFVTAHPDDEPNALLVRLARGLGLRTILLTVTRGEGGQNVIGPELSDALGVLRTEELMAGHRYDAVEQRFGRAYEFGYSFSVEETFEKWGRVETLGDIVRVIREFHPDVVLTLPLESAGGGQHHQAVAQLTRDAFRVAADPGRFAAQLREGLRPWQARKLYQGGPGGYRLELPGTPVRVPTGTYDPLLGLTWQQLGSLARSLHRCQGTRQLMADPGEADALYFLVDSEPAVGGMEDDILDGFETTLAGLARFAPASASLASDLSDLQRQAAAARAAFDPRSPGAAVPPLVVALEAVRDLMRRLTDEVEDTGARAEIEDRLRDEERDVVQALVLAQGLVVEARADDGLVTPGQAFGVTLSLWNHGDGTVDVQTASLEMPTGWTAESGGGARATLGPRGEAHMAFTVTAAPDARPSEPYWRRRSDLDRHDLLVPEDETLPWSPPDVVARLRCRLAGVDLPLSTPAVFRYPGPFVGGEKQHVVQVVPELSVRVSPPITAVSLEGPPRPFDVSVFVRHGARGPGEATVRLASPAGWSVEPVEARLVFAYEGEEVGARFVVTPPRTRTAGHVALEAVAARGGREYRDTVQAVDYDHIQRRQRLHPAEVQVVVLDVEVASDASVGYVMGSGDAVADAIRQLGVPLTLLDTEDLAFGDLSRYSTIVTGIRAYETREDLRSVHPRLMEWVGRGGHLVVQYNRARFNRVSPHRRGPADEASPFAPYPAVTTLERITDETAPLEVLVPDHPLLATPNRIGPADWEGWVQERGTYFLDARDPRYVELLAGTDPFPNNPGQKRGILVDAKVGKGTWTYVGLVLFRQVPAGVPGGWRLLANLVSRPRR